MTDKTFIKGLFIDVKETQFGEIYKLAIKTEDFAPFLQQNTNDKGWLRIDILTSKEGKKYAVLNTYKPKENNTSENDLPF